MKIGDTTLKIAKPDKLDDRLVALTGCSSAEVLRELSGYPIASTVAAALLPFVQGETSLPELADLIGRAGVDNVLPGVLALYNEKAPDAPQAKA